MRPHIVGCGEYDIVSIGEQKAEPAGTGHCRTHALSFRSIIHLRRNIQTQAQNYVSGTRVYHAKVVPVVFLDGVFCSFSCPNMHSTFLNLSPCLQHLSYILVD
jgi:hypothetical protein